MAVWHIKSTGTKNDSTASTADDWTDANCYPFNVAGGSEPDDFQQVWNSCPDGDEIIFDDETHTATEQLNLTNGGGSPKTVTLKSRSGNADNCVLTSDLAGSALFAANPTAQANSVIINDIGFTRTGTFTGTGGCILTVTQLQNDITFNDCKFSNITTNCASDNDSGMIVSLALRATSARTVTFNDCDFDSLTCASNERVGITVSNTFNDVIFNDCTLTNSSLTANAGAGNALVGWVLNLDGSLVVNGFTASNLTFTANGTDSMEGGVFRQGTAGDLMEINDAHLNGATIITNGSDQVGVLSTGSGTGNSFTIRNSSVQNCINDSLGNAEGCLAIAGGTSNVNIYDCVAHDNRGFYGCCGQNTSSGTMYAEGCLSYNNTALIEGGGAGGNEIEGVDFYMGGSGNATLIGCETYGATVLANTNASSVFGFNNTASPRTDQNKTITIQNCTFADPVTTSVSPVKFSNSNATTKTLTLVIDNTIISSGATDDMVLSDGTALTDTICTLTNCNIDSIDSTGNTVGGAPTDNNPVSGDPLFISTTDHDLQAGSPCIGAGYKWAGMNGQNTANQPLPAFDIDVGVQSKANPFHPVNL